MAEPVDASRLDTLDEPIWRTLWRDVKRVLIKLSHVIVPRRQRVSVLRDWDLWGPLLLCLFLASALAFRAPSEQTALVFALVFIVTWLGAAIVTINAVVLGSTLSFLQSVCILGYCLFPLAVSALCCQFYRNFIFRSIVVLVGIAWSIFGSVDFMNPIAVPGKKTLTIFPLILFYSCIGWMVLIS